MYIYIYQHMPMGAKTAPLRQGLRYGTRLISWLLSSHFWLFHLHTSCFPSGAIKAVIVCRSLPSAAWQRLMLMMTSGMMASNSDPLEWAVQLLVCRLKNKHYQSHRCHRRISNLDLCYPLGVLAMPKRKRRTSTGETVTVKLVTALNHYILWGWELGLGPSLKHMGWILLKLYFANQPIRYFTKALMDRMDDNCVQWIRKTGEFWPGGDIRISGNLWLRAAFTKSSLSKVPRENSIRQSLYEIIAKRSYVFNLVLFGAMLCCVGFPTYNLSYSFITQYRLWSKRWRLGYLGHAASYLGPVSLLMLFSLMSL